MTKEQKELLKSFGDEYAKTLEQIKNSGAVTEEMGDYTIGKFALLLTAKKYAPLAAETKKELANLRHFV